MKKHKKNILGKERICGKLWLSKALSYFFTLDAV